MVRRGWVLWMAMSRQELFGRIRRDSWQPRVCQLSDLRPWSLSARSIAIPQSGE